jgi:hypothetical protein
MGQSERGSYVVTVVSELSRQNRELIPGHRDPFERQVTRTLSDALGAVKDSCATALQTGNVHHFREVVNRGVSANLCEALVGMSGAGRRELQIAIGWSRVHPPPGDILSEVTLETTEILTVEQAVPVLRLAAPYEAFEMIGLVVGLRRAQGEETGHVVVMGPVETKIRKVHIELDAADYDFAIAAHRQKSAVHCTGELVRVGRSFVLRDPQGFALIGA